VLDLDVSPAFDGIVIRDSSEPEAAGTLFSCSDILLLFYESQVEVKD